MTPGEALFLALIAAALVVALQTRAVNQGELIMSHLDRLTAEVAEIKAAGAAAATRLDEIAARLREAAGDAAAVNALADELDAAGNALVAAVERNPVEEPPAPPA